MVNRVVNRVVSSSFTRAAGQVIRLGVLIPSRYSRQHSPTATATATRTARRSKRETERGRKKRREGRGTASLTIRTGRKIGIVSKCGPGSHKGWVGLRASTGT